MKKLILCEGKHDRIFFEKLFTKMNIPASEVRFFDQETRDKLRDLRDAESKELMKFSEEYNPYKILVKSEAGENKAIKIFSRYLSYCIEKRQKDIEKTILMLDLDKNQSENRLEKKRLRKNMIKKKLSELEQMINAKRVVDTVYIETKTIEETDSIYLGIFFFIPYLNLILLNLINLFSAHSYIYQRPITSTNCTCKVSCM